MPLFSFDIVPLRHYDWQIHYFHFRHFFDAIIIYAFIIDIFAIIFIDDARHLFSLLILYFRPLFRYAHCHIMPLFSLADIDYISHWLFITLLPYFHLDTPLFSH